MVTVRKFKWHARFALPLLLSALATPAYAEFTLTGTADGQPFLLSGESREKVVGGSMQLGDDQFDITHVSVHRLKQQQASPGIKVKVMLTVISRTILLWLFIQWRAIS